MHKLRWVGLIVGLLLFSVGTQVVLIVSALSSPSFAVVPDYEERARNWDDVQRQQALNERLAFTVDVSLTPLSEGLHFVDLQLWDTWGKPIRDAEISIVAFQLSRAQYRHELAMLHVEDNHYRQQATLRPAGLWELEITVDRGDDRYTELLRLEVDR